MNQCCEVYINLFCGELDKSMISNWLKKFFSHKENLEIYGNPLNYLEVADDAEGLVVIDLEVDIPCSYIHGYPGTRWEPPEPAYVEDNFNAEDFYNWIKDILPKEFDIDIEIDNSSNIPSEEELVKDYEEERYYREEY